jgi:hypothetical protein
LEEFAARESERLTADERRKLIAVTEKILAEHFTTPLAMREAFRYERLKTGLASPTFFAFSDKWATNVGETAEDTVETTQSIYESLLRGLKRSLERGGESKEVLEPVPPAPAKQKPTVQRQRFFR